RIYLIWTPMKTQEIIPHRLPLSLHILSQKSLMMTTFFSPEHMMSASHMTSTTKLHVSGLQAMMRARMPLKPELVFQDISQDHAHKTVTIEDHPHLLVGQHASVHPCKHAAVMKKIIDVIVSQGGAPEVDKYLFIFLKFMASVIPTIEYDYTMDFDLGSTST
uniref:Uncharacterized protein n=1 Tax=Aegilops tauschii subsp. strangulata TaxID=200361 RepID=A0A452YW32_AEGTS